jgi:hypothetical protein
MRFTAFFLHDAYEKLLEGTDKGAFLTDHGYIGADEEGF